MKTLELLQNRSLQIPLNISWYLSDLGQSQGLQELYIRQSPQRLKTLREHAIAQSAISSNRIEGVQIERSRVGTVVFGNPPLKDRDEEEVAGYRDALNLIHAEPRLPLSETNIMRLHKLCRGQIWDAGKYKEKPVDIIELLPNGERRIRFQSVPPSETPSQLCRSIELWETLSVERGVSALILLAAFNLDFLCIHPFRDGNGRVSRLLLLQTCYLAGIEVGRYVSLERLIEEHRERYYETLEQSSHRWHQGKHDPWPYIGYLLFIIKKAYDEFEQRAGAITAPRGEKTAFVEAAIKRQTEEFRVSDLQKACPGVSLDLIRKVLKHLKGTEVECLGRGHSARWRKLN
ncbi:MAG: Fic family protein [Kiritimatiellales bacterium]